MSEGSAFEGYLSSLKELDEVLTEYSWKQFYEETDDTLTRTYYEKGEVTIDVDDAWGGLVKASSSCMESSWFNIRDCKIDEGKLAFVHTEYEEDNCTEYLEMIRIKL